MKKRINITLEEQLLNRVNQEAKKGHISRNEFIKKTLESIT